MKIEKGIVKYKDRNDIVCTYGTTENGTRYYFLDENDAKKLANGNRIVSALLVEAVDPMVKATKIGVIDNDGNVVVPCVNRSIRVVDDGTILVEASVPISQSVIDSVKLRNDPLSATKLVSTPATIKDKINFQMGGDGKYIFNDQFSEATVCDIDGNNLVDNEYYSFIASANGKLYMSKNTADSEVKEFVLKNDNDISLDVSEIMVDKNVVDEALASSGNEVIEELDVPGESLESLGEEKKDVTESAIEGLPLASESEMDALSGAPDFMTLDSPSVLGSVTSGSTGDEIMPYNDEISTIVPMEPTAASASGDEIIPYNDEISTVVPIEPVVAGASGDEIMPYNDEISTIVPMEPVAAGASGDEVIPYNDEISTIVPMEPTATSASGDEVIPYNDEISTIVPIEPVAIEKVGSEDALLGNGPAISDELKEFVAMTEGNGSASTTNQEEGFASADGFVPPILPQEDEEVVSAEDKKNDAVVSSLGSNDSSQEKVKNTELSEASAKEETVVADPQDRDEFTATDTNDVHNVEVSAKLIDPDVVAYTVDKDGNGVNDSNESQKIIDIFKDTSIRDNALKGIEDIRTSSSEMFNGSDLSNLDYVSNSGIGYDRRPIESYGSHEYSVDNKYDSMFSPVPTDRITYNEKDNIMSDVVRSMSELMRQNREQRGAIVQYQDRLDAAESQKRVLAEQYKQQTARVENLSNKLRGLEESASRLETRAQMFESRIRDQEKIIAAQERELRTLRPQLEGKQDLVKLLADAKALLDNTNDYSYEDSSSYYRRAA